MSPSLVQLIDASARSLVSPSSSKPGRRSPKGPPRRGKAPSPTEPPRRTSSDDGPRRIGVCVVGGGLLASVRAIAMLAGIEDRLREECPDGIPIHTLVGSRSGALVCAMLAGGMRPTTLLEHMQSEFPFHARLRVRMELGNALTILRDVGRTLWRRGRALAKDPLGAFGTDEFRALLESLPPGIMNTHDYEAVLNRLFWDQGIPRYFRDGERALRILAWDVNRGRMLALGSPGHDDMSVPRAVAAASSIAGIFTPTAVSGTDAVELPPALVHHLDIAVSAGADGLLVLFPSPPATIRSEPILPDPARPGGVRDIGLAAIWNQTQRQQMLEGLRIALARHAQTAPHIPVSVVMPPPADPRLLMQTVARESAREAATRDGLVCGRRAASPGTALYELIGPRKAPRDRSKQRA